MVKKKILLDTDIGTDIDDAVCLAYLLAHPDCDLLGITTVSGEAKKRAMLASAVCRHAGRDVPIHPGAELPLNVPLKQKEAQQASKLDRWDHRSAFPKGEAVDFLRHTIRSHPGEITLLTISPLTNIALLFSIDPEIPALLQRLVMMCGTFFDPRRRDTGRSNGMRLVIPTRRQSSIDPVSVSTGPSESTSRIGLSNRQKNSEFGTAVSSR